MTIYEQVDEDVTLWEYIQYRHDEFPREQYEEVRSVGEELEDKDESHNEELLRSTRHKLAFHDFLERTEREFDERFADLFRSYIGQYVSEHVEWNEDSHTFDPNSVPPALRRAVNEIEGTALEQLKKPLSRVPEYLQVIVRENEAAGGEWSEMEELVERVAEAERIDEAGDILRQADI